MSGKIEQRHDVPTFRHDLQGVFRAHDIKIGLPESAISIPYLWNSAAPLTLNVRT